MSSRGSRIRRSHERLTTNTHSQQSTTKDESMIFNNNNPVALQRELNGLSRGLGRSDVQTIFQGDGASASSKKIYLPNMPIDAQLTDEQMRVFRGYHIHEVGHILHTNDRVWKAEVNSYVNNDEYWRKDVFNALEDVMIERKINDQYAGAKRNLEETVQRVLGNNLAQIEEHGMASTGDMVPYAILQMCRKAMGYKSSNLDTFLDMLPDDVVEEADKWVDQVLAAEDTSSIVKIARKLGDWMEAEGVRQQPPQPPTQPPQPQDGTPTDNPDSDFEADGDTEDDPKPDDDDDGGEEGNSRVQQAQTNRNTDAEDSKPLTLNELMNRALEDVIDEEAKKVISEAEDSDFLLPYRSINEYAPYEDIEAQRETHPNADEYLKERSTRYDNLLKSMGKHLRSRSSSLARVLQSQENEFWVGGKEHGRLDRNRMVGIVTGEKNIWAQQVRQQTQSTAVMVMMDQSGSMSFGQVRRALIALNETLARAHVPYGIIGWSCSNYQILKTMKEKGRTEHVKTQIGGMGDWSGGTDPYPALLMCYEKFHEWSQAERKIVLFCSDAAFCSSDSHKMRKLNALLEPQGYEPYGVLIDSHNAQSLEIAFPRGVVKTDSKKLPETMLDQLQKLLAIGANSVAA